MPKQRNLRMESPKEQETSGPTVLNPLWTQDTLLQVEPIEVGAKEDVKGKVAWHLGEPEVGWPPEGELRQSPFCFAGSGGS